MAGIKPDVALRKVSILERCLLRGSLLYSNLGFFVVHLSNQFFSNVD